MPDYDNDKLAAAQWARNILADGNFVILDTETTALHNASVVQISIIRSDGSIALDSLVNPECEIEAGAMAIHGITPDMVKDAPTLRELLSQIMLPCQGKTLVIYNKGYDYPILTRLLNPWEHPDVQCAMEQYAAFIGDWNDYRGNYKWQKLPAVKGYQAHSALGDCHATLALIKQMAAWTKD